MIAIGRLVNGLYILDNTSSCVSCIQNFVASTCNALSSKLIINTNVSNECNKEINSFTNFITKILLSILHARLDHSSYHKMAYIPEKLQSLLIKVITILFVP